MSMSRGSELASEEVEEELLLPPNLMWKLALLVHHSEVHISSSRDAQRFRISIQSEAKGILEPTYHINFKDFQMKFYDQLSKLPNPYEYLDHLGSYFVQEKCLFLEVHFTSIDQMKRCLDGIDGAGLVEKVNDTFRCFIGARKMILFKLKLVVCSSIDQKFRFVTHENASYAYELVYTPNPAFATVHIRCKSTYMEIKNAYDELLKCFPDFFGCITDQNLSESDTKGASSPQFDVTECSPDISDKELYEIAEEINPEKWRKLGLHMGIDDNNLKRIEKDNHGDILNTIFTMLSEAKRNLDPSKFRQVLAVAIYQTKDLRLAKRIDPQLKVDQLAQQSTLQSEDDGSKLLLVDGELKFYDRDIAEKHLANSFWSKMRDMVVPLIEQKLAPYSMQAGLVTTGSLIVNVSILSFNGCYRLVVNIFSNTFIADVETALKALGYNNSLQVDFKINGVLVTPENCYDLYVESLHGLITQHGLTVEQRTSTKQKALKFTKSTTKSSGNALPSSLAEAVRRGDVNAVKSLIANGANPNEYFDGHTPLHIAAFLGMDEIVNILVHSGASLDIKTSLHEQYTPMHLAANSGHLTTIKLLVELSANIDVRSQRGRTPLWLAATEGYAHIAEYLISQNADPNAQDSISGTPLHAAAGQNRKSVVEVLIKGGADVIIPDDVMSTPVHEALKTGDVDLLRLIISKYPSVVNQIVNEPLLTAACKMQNLEIVKFLLTEASADPNVENNDHLTPLTLASLHENTELIELLVSHGAAMNIISENFGSVLHLAAKEGKINATKKLLQLGAPCDIIDNDGYTPLRDALVEKQHETVTVLLDAGASIQAGTPSGKLPLFHVAAKNNDVEMLEILLNHNCDSFVTFGDGSTALHRAAYFGNSDAIHFLCCQTALLNLKSAGGMTPLYTAIRQKNFTSAMEILIYDPDVNICNHDGVSPLLMCIDFNGPVELVEQLVLHKAKIHYRFQIDVLGRAVNPKSPIQLACMKGQAENLKILLEANRVFVQESDVKVQHILIFSTIDSGSLETLRVLLEFGANPNVLANNESLSALIKACFCGHVKMMQLLIQYGGEPGMACGEKQITPLIVACEQNRIEMVKILAPRVDVNHQVEGNGYTALHTIAIDGSAEIANVLINNGAMIDKESNAQLTPLHVAASAGNMPVIDVLLNFNAGIDVQDIASTTPLMRGIQNQKFDAVKSLLAAGANVEVRATHGLHALHFAAYYGDSQILELLIVRYKNENVRDDSGMAPLHLATLEGNISIVKALLFHGAFHSVTNNNGFSPLHIAAAYDYIEIAELLVKTGASIEVEADGSTPVALSKSEKMENLLSNTKGQKQANDEPGKMKHDMQEKHVEVSFTQEKTNTTFSIERRATKLQELSDIQKHYKELFSTEQTLQ